MKKIFPLLLVMFISVSNLYATKIAINTTHTSMDGCEWTITGWVDVSTTWGWPPIEINHYDITISGPCGKHRFVGGVNSSGGGTTFYNAHLFNLETGEEEDLNSFDQLAFILNHLEALYDE